MKMKVINLTIGKGSPVMRVTPKTHGTARYRIENEGVCNLPKRFPKHIADKTIADKYPRAHKVHQEPIVLIIADVSMPDRYYGEILPIHVATYHIYNDDKSYEIIGDVAINDKVFVVYIPPLDYGYYYIDVMCWGGTNRTMINVV